MSASDGAGRRPDAKPIKSGHLNPVAQTEDEREAYNEALERERTRYEQVFIPLVLRAIISQMESAISTMNQGLDLDVSIPDAPIDEAYREVLDETIQTFAEETAATQGDVDADRIEQEKKQYMDIVVPSLVLASNATLRRVVTGSIAAARNETAADAAEDVIISEAVATVSRWVEDVAESTAKTRTEHLVVTGSEKGTEIGMGDSGMLRVWNSRLDGRERPWHRAAHGQERTAAENFRVGGEELAFPGDPSHGASPSNFINCRCYLTYVRPEDFNPGDFVEEREAG